MMEHLKQGLTRPAGLPPTWLLLNFLELSTITLRAVIKSNVPYLVRKELPTDPLGFITLASVALGGMAPTSSK